MNDFFTGFISNFIPTFCFYPLDTLMVHRQTGYESLSTRRLFRGIFTASFNTSLCNGIIYSVYHDSSAEYWWCAPLLSSFLIQPFENLKIQNQVHRPIPNTLGFFFRGYLFCLCKEVVAVPVYFETYRTLTTIFETTEMQQHFICGGFAGIHSWFWSYPFSTMKANHILGYPWLLSPHLLYKGFSFCALRAFFFNGLYFCIVEKTKSSPVELFHSSS